MVRKKSTSKKAARKKSTSKKAAAAKAVKTRERNFDSRVKKEPYENRDKMREFNRRKKELQRAIWS